MPNAEVRNILAPAEQAKGLAQFFTQCDLTGDAPRLLGVAVIRTSFLTASLARAASFALGKTNNERCYAIGCAMRAWTHFNPKFGYCAEAPCLRCTRTIRDTKEIAIVLLTLPPWSKKTRTEKTAFISGFICSACDLPDEGAEKIWIAEMEQQGIPLLPTGPEGTA
jgi:hypothetical protein